MNLIEQLGGYEKAKAGLHRLKLEKKDLLTCGDLVVVKSEIDAALLEYRREHNIFEVGDYYAYLYEWDSDLDIVCKFNPSEWGDHLWNIKNMIRHATDEEIAAGHRL